LERAAKRAMKARRAGKGPKRPYRRRAAGKIKEVIRQQNLGQQTRSVCLLRAGRPDARAKIFKAVGAASNYVRTFTGPLTTSGVSGRQCWASLVMAPTTDLFEINERLAGRGSGTTFSNDAPTRYLLENCKQKLNISNVGQAATKVTFYHCTAKRDLYAVMDFTSLTGGQYSWAGIFPDNAVQQGVSAATNGPLSGSTSFYIPGVLPYESQIFNQYFKVHKETEVLLAVGGSHHIETNKSFDRLLDATVFGNTEMAAILGVSEFILMRAEGQTGVQENGDITVAQTQIVYTCSNNYRFTQVQMSEKFLATQDNITADADAVNVISGATGDQVSATGLIV